MGLRANIGIRGLDPDRSRTVLVLEDGVPVALAPFGEPELYYSPPIERMERIEVVKGSGSILFGPQTIGGVINYVTPDAPRSPWGEALVRGGSTSGLVRMRYGGTWDNTRASVSVLRRTADGLAGLIAGASDATGKIGFTTARASTGIKLSMYDETSNATYVGLTDSLVAVDPYAHPSPTDRLWIRRYAFTASHEFALGTAATLRTNAYA